MPYRQVKYYQEIGDFEAAYRIARKVWTENPTLTWPKSTLAWLIVRMLKVYAHAYSQERFFELLKELDGMGVPQEDRKLWGAALWPIRDMARDSLEMQWFTPQLGDRLFEAVKDFPTEKPSEAYSALISEFIRLGSLWPRLAEFIEWWGFENFTEFDYRRYPEKGRQMSLAEKVMEAYLRATKREGRELSETFLEGLRELERRDRRQAEEIYSIIESLKIDWHGKH